VERAVIARAKLKYLGVSAQKTRLVADQVRGKGVGEALGMLRLSSKRVAQDVRKVVSSALANAQQSDPNVDVDRLVIARVVVDDAPALKRSRHASMGRVFPVHKRACHVTVDLDVPAGKGTR
jgi:large subunit ribosomal protein L22